MIEQTFEKPPLSRYLKVTVVASLLGFAIQLLTGLALIAPVSILITIVLIWLILKCYQSLLASWIGVEFRTATIFWYLIISGIAAGLLGGIVVGGLLLKVALGVSMSSTASQVVTALSFYVINALIAALLFRLSNSYIPAWRPIAAYWRPFYAGLHFTLSSKPQGPPETPNA